MRRISLAGAVLLAATLTACGSQTGGSGSYGGTRGPVIGPGTPTPLTPRTRTPTPEPTTPEPTTPEVTEESEPEQPDESGPDESESTVDGNTVSGHAYHSDGSPISGAMIYFRIVPESYGALYRTSTGSDGSYSYRLPAGVYIVLASIDNDDPNLIVDLEPRQTGPDGVASVSVPPAHVVDFDEP